MLKNIKILATVGPSSGAKATIKKMDESGVDLFRINLSHTKINNLESIIKNIKSHTEKPICLDTEGAQIRTGSMENNCVKINNNEVVELVNFKEIGNSLKIPLYPIDLAKLLEVGDVLHLDFNQATIQVIKKEKQGIFARVLAGGLVGSNKGVYLERNLALEAFTKKDIAAFKIAKKLGIKYISLSFASKKEDITALRRFFDYPVAVISKVESKKALINLEEICKNSDAILIDRGDLSREVPIEKIGLAQTHIISVAKKIKTSVYVATNLLESMVNNFSPTRAEVNDITNTLLSGAKGLVLAAETAIGKHPVECVRMAHDIISEVAKYKKEKGKEYISSIYEYNLIEPHGGKLVQSFIENPNFEKLAKLPQIVFSENNLLDLFQICEGVYSPLQGFMDYKQLISVLDNYKLPNGVVWTLPILLQLPKEKVNFKKGQQVALQYFKDGKIYGAMQVSEIKKIDANLIAQKWFGTKDTAHPGVKAFKEKGDYIIGGKVFLARKSSLYPEFYSLTPKQTRGIFKNLGWKKIVGFHTRNVIHLGHEFVQKQALSLAKADALFISPVIGPKKTNDFTAKAIIQAYEAMIKNNYYAPFGALIGAFATYSRYSGPREAVFTALCRKNFGCSHFVVGRDHTGVGDFYSPNASQEIFDKLGDIGIKPIMFDEVYFCKDCNKATDKCPHTESQRIKISGTKARQCLLNNERIPESLMRREISDILEKMHKNTKEKLFES